MNNTKVMNTDIISVALGNSVVIILTANQTHHQSINFKIVYFGTSRVRTSSKFLKMVV